MKEIERVLNIIELQLLNSKSIVGSSHVVIDYKHMVIIRLFLGKYEDISIRREGYFFSVNHYENTYRLESLVANIKNIIENQKVISL